MCTATQASVYTPPTSYSEQSLQFTASHNANTCVQEAHLEEVILMYHTTVGQVLDQSVGEGGFPSVGYAEGSKVIINANDWRGDGTNQINPLIND